MSSNKRSLVSKGVCVSLCTCAMHTHICGYIVYVCLCVCVMCAYVLCVVHVCSALHRAGVPGACACCVCSVMYTGMSCMVCCHVFVVCGTYVFRSEC